MLDPQSDDMRLADILCMRMEEIFDGDPDEALEWLAGVIGEERVATLLTGCIPRLSRQEREDIALALCLDPSLFAAILGGASSEMVTECARRLLPIDDQHCDECDGLIGNVWAASTLSRALALDVLEHVWTEPDPERIAAVERMADLHRVFSDLEPAAQLRVLAHAYSERQQGRSAGAASATAMPFPRLTGESPTGSA